jgi:hypothetical protein
MAKATVITPALLINTGRAPAGNNGANANGQVVRVDLFFDTVTPDINISLTAVMQQGCFNTVQCIYVDNSLNPATVILTVPGIQQRIVVNGFSQSLEPLYVSDTAVASSVAAHCVTPNALGFPVSIWFSNVPQPFYSKNNLLNSVFEQYGLAHCGNIGAPYATSWSFDLRGPMAASGVADWPTIRVNNTAGFQHLYVYDAITGNIVYVVNPYTIAQFETAGLGTYMYTFFAIDQLLMAPQNAFNYGYDFSVMFKSMKQSPYNIESSGAMGGLYTQDWLQAFAANQIVTLPPIESRANVQASAVNTFLIKTGISWTAATLVAGAYVVNLDKTIACTMGRLVRIVNGAIAQNITIQDRY